MGENLVPVVQLHAEEGIRERLDNRAFDLDGAVFLGHVLRASFCLVVVRAGARLAWPGSPGAGEPAPAWLTPALASQADEITGRGSEGPTSRSHTRAPGRQPRENPAEWTGVECTRPSAPMRTDGIWDTVGPGVIPRGAGPGGSGPRSTAGRPAPTTGTRYRRPPRPRPPRGPPGPRRPRPRRPWPPSLA